jgi:hypothetical protein
VVPPSLRRNDHACGWRPRLSARQAHRNKACKRSGDQFRDEKVVDYVSIIDSFDAVEQLLGYNLDAYDGYRVEGNVVTV